MTHETIKPTAPTEAERAKTPSPPPPPAADKEEGGAPGLEPTRYGDWEHKGIAWDF